MRNVFLVLLLSGSIGVDADDPSHALMDHKYWVCEESKCSGQLIPDSDLGFSSATAGAIPPL